MTISSRIFCLNLHFLVTHFANRNSGHIDLFGVNPRFVMRVIRLFPGYIFSGGFVNGFNKLKTNYYKSENEKMKII